MGRLNITVIVVFSLFFPNIAISGEFDNISIAVFPDLLHEIDLKIPASSKIGLNYLYEIESIAGAKVYIEGKEIKIGQFISAQEFGRLGIKLSNTKNVVGGSILLSRDYENKFARKLTPSKNITIHISPLTYYKEDLQSIVNSLDECLGSYTVYRKCKEEADEELKEFYNRYEHFSTDELAEGFEIMNRCGSMESIRRKAEKSILMALIRIKDLNIINMRASVNRLFREHANLISKANQNCKQAIVDGLTHSIKKNNINVFWEKYEIDKCANKD